MCCINLLMGLGPRGGLAASCWEAADLPVVTHVAVCPRRARKATTGKQAAEAASFTPAETAAKDRLLAHAARHRANIPLATALLREAANLGKTGSTVQLLRRLGQAAGQQHLLHLLEARWGCSPTAGCQAAVAAPWEVARRQPEIFSDHTAGHKLLSFPVAVLARGRGVSAHSARSKRQPA